MTPEPSLNQLYHQAVLALNRSLEAALARRLRAEILGAIETVSVHDDTEELELDRPLNYDPDAPGIAAYPTIEVEQPHQALTIDELLGPEVAELIRANKLPEQRGDRHHRTP